MLTSRIVIDNVRPRTTTGEYPAKAVTGQHVRVGAHIFKDGHDVVSARVRWRAAGPQGTEASWSEAPLNFVMNDEWEGEMVAPHSIGMHEFVIEAWLDHYKTWRHKTEVKLHAGVDVSVELAEGVNFFRQRVLEVPANQPEVAADLQRALNTLAEESLTPHQRLLLAFDDEIAELVAGPGETDVISQSSVQRLWVDRTRAGFSTWYCLFPRSLGGFKGVIEHLDYVRSMDFDVLYLTPIHPIGDKFRKGKNNTLNPLPDDVGVPYAIGSSEGGHLAIHPDLGTIEDFEALVAACHEHGMEVALDNALQCSPDHPWVKEHPEWFHHRPDGSIAYAENPPKKYQDIYPINFWPEREEDRVALWEAAKETFTYWIDHGVKIFRVDNPHTKPLAFWSWCIAEVQRMHPDVIFLSEAFTRPKMMAKLAEVGFTQSYTYFTWRTWKQELIDYAVEVCVSEKADFMRPNFWPNTHDLLTGPLRNGTVGAFKSRFLLAATMVPNYGIYSGYELMENEPLSDANTDYLHSEKYEIRIRDFSRDSSLAPYIAKVNKFRNGHRAMQELGNIWFHFAENDAVIAYSKRSQDGSDTVLVVVNLDPFNSQESTIHLNLDKLGIEPGEQFCAVDEITGRPFYWHGSQAYVWLPANEPGHLLSIQKT